MVDQPGAGGSHSYKIRGHSRPKRSTKPYARPSDRKKGVLETVKDFFSPSWLVDFWKGKSSPEDVEVEEDVETEDRLSDTTARITEDPSRPFDAQNTEIFDGTSTGTGESRGKVFGNGGLGTSHAHTRSKGKNALSTFLAAKSSYRTIRETTTIRGIEDEGNSEGAARGNDKNIASEAASTSSKTEPQGRPSSRAAATPSPLSLYLNAGPSRQPLQSSFLTSTPMQGTSSLSGTSGSSGILNTPAMSSTPMDTSKTPAPTPSESLLLYGQQTEARAKPVSAFKTKPSFSVTAFGSPLPPRPTSRGSMHPYASPFYSGRTSFGGAASQKTGTKRIRVSSPRSAETNQPVKKQIKPTPIAASGSGGVASQTAKRILEALEKMSTPLIDAKKIPPSPPFSTSSSPLSFTQSQRRRPPTSRPVGSPRKLKAQFGAPPVQALSVPQRAAISRLQPRTTPEGSSTAGTSTTLAMERTTEPAASTRGATTATITKPLSSFTPMPLPMSLSPDVPASRGGGKIKRDRASAHYTSGRSTRAEEEEDAEIVNPLPEVTAAVPLQFKSLPSFSFTASSSSTTSTKTDMVSSVVPKSQDITKNNFKFSAPAPKVSSSTVLSTKKASFAQQAFSFSQPAPVRISETTKADGTSNASTSSAPGLSLDKFKPASGSWECDTCMINNKSGDTKCVACKTPKPTPKVATSSFPSNNLLNNFAPPTDSWSCDTCLIVNKTSDSKCVACQSSKPASSQASKAGPVSGRVNGSDELQKKFAPVTGSWECETCMLNNKASDDKCVACQTPKPGAKPAVASTFGASHSSSNLLSKFTPVSGSWTCDTCMIVNKAELVKCLACETPKPGAKVPETTGAFKLASGSSFASSPFKFGTDKSKESDSSSKPSFQFGVPVGSETASSESKPTFQFGAPQPKDAKAPAIKFGVPSTTASESKPAFQFGVPSSKDVPAPAVTFGVPPSTSSESKPAFQFGSKDNNKTDVSEKETTASPSPAKKSSIAQAAATGFLKVSGMTPPPTGEANTASKSLSSSIGDATKAGFLKIPTAGDSAPPNVNLFGAVSSGEKPAASPFAGLSNPAASLKRGPPPAYPGSTLDKPSGGTTLPSLPFAFGAGSDADKPAPFNFTGSSAAAKFPSLDQNSEAPKPGQFNFTGSTSASSGIGANSQAVGDTTSAASVPPFSFTGIATSTAASTGFQAAAPAVAAQPQRAVAAQPQRAVAAQPQRAVAAQPFAFGAGASSFNFSGSASGVSSATTASSTPGTFSFSAVPTNAPVAAPAASSASTFVFGATPATSAPAASTFAFNATGDTNATQKAAFGGFPAGQPFAFGGASTMPSVSEESMDADGNNNSSQPAMAPPTALAAPGALFGSAPAAGSAPSVGFAFGQQSTNAGFNFAASTGQQSMFKFGGSAPAAAAPAPVTFPMGAAAALPFGAPAGQAPAAASGGFNFSAQAPNSLGSPAPTFNFVGGSGAMGGFTAGTGDTASPVATKRVIKRGVRRSRRGAQ